MTNKHLAALYIVAACSLRAFIFFVVMYVVFWLDHNPWFLLLLILIGGKNVTKRARRIANSGSWFEKYGRIDEPPKAKPLLVLKSDGSFVIVCWNELFNRWDDGDGNHIEITAWWPLPPTRKLVSWILRYEYMNDCWRWYEQEGTQEELQKKLHEMIAINGADAYRNITLKEKA